LQPDIVVPTTAQEQVKFLRDNLGDPFVDWILAAPSDPLTEQQEQVLRLLIMVIIRGQPRTSGGASLPMRYNLIALSQYNEAVGATLFNHLRSLTSGEEAPTFPRSGDSLLDALTDFAVELYGELLLIIRYSHFIPIGSFSSPVASELKERIADAVELPFASTAGSGIYTVTSTGRGGGIQVDFAGPSIVNAAWRMACLTDAAPSLEKLISALPPALESARRALKGRTVRVKGVYSFTGLTLPPDTVLELGWGRIRAARPSDHPEDVSDMTQRRTVSGSSGIQITDAGEIILEADVGYRLYIRDAARETGRGPAATSRNELEKRATQVRFALLLAVERDVVPVLVPTWSLFIEPISQGGSVGLSDPQSFAKRHPTALTDSEASTWRDWIRRLDTTGLSSFGVAPARLIRAVAERRDPFDSLIDAVICWESMFGGDKEMTLRVSSAMARILRPSGPERRATRKRLSEIYELRSRVVHGTDAKRGLVQEASKQAISYALEAFRVILANRRDLINMSGAERSVTILME
jgi:hypothetical protein